MWQPYYAFRCLQISVTLQLHRCRQGLSMLPVQPPKASHGFAHRGYVLLVQQCIDDHLSLSFLAVCPLHHRIPKSIISAKSRRAVEQT